MRQFTRTPQAYSALLTDPRWQKVRLLVFQRDDWGCRLCGATASTLQVHHIKYTASMPWDELQANLVTVCEGCHHGIRHCTNTFQEAEFRGRLRKIGQPLINVTRRDWIKMVKGAPGLNLASVYGGDDD